MRIALLVVLLAASAAPVTAQPAPSASDSEELRRITEQRFDANANNDRAFYERLLAPAFQMLEPFKFPAHTKQEYLDAEFPAGRPRRPRSTIRDLRATPGSGVAVVSYEVVEPYPLGGGQHFDVVTRRLDTYARVNGAWRLVSMAIAERPTWPEPAAIDPAVYSQYAGTYRLTAETFVTITREGSRLMAQTTGQEKVELFPENETTFFDRTDSPLARTVFVRGPSGAVAAQIYRAQGQVLRAVKVK